MKIFLCPVYIYIYIYIYVIFSYCFVVVKVVSNRSVLSKWHKVPRFYLCVCLFLAYPFGCDDINIGLETTELLTMYYYYYYYYCVSVMFMFC
jgi:hypothetical protein